MQLQICVTIPLVSGYLCGCTANSVVPLLLSSISQGARGGGVTGKKSEPLISQLRPLATRTPGLGLCGQGVWL